MRTRVITWNLHSEAGASKDRLQALGEALVSMQADVWCLQGVQRRTNGKGDIYITVEQALAGHHLWFHPTDTTPDGEIGLLIASRLPAARVGAFVLPHDHPHSSPRQVLHVHFEGGLAVLCTQVVFSPRLRMQQIEALVNGTRGEETLLICGDLAAHPHDVAAMAYPAGLGDALGWHTQATWPVVNPHLPPQPRADQNGLLLPHLPLRHDYILGRGVRFLGSGVIQTSWVSDHLPLWTDISWEERTGRLWAGSTREKEHEEVSVQPSPGAEIATQREPEGLLVTTGGGQGTPDVVGNEDGAGTALAHETLPVPTSPKTTAPATAADPAMTAQKQSVPSGEQSEQADPAPQQPSRRRKRPRWAQTRSR